MRPIPLNDRRPAARNRAPRMGTWALTLVIVAVSSLRGVAQSSVPPIRLVPLSRSATGTADTGGPPVSAVPGDAPGLSPSIPPRTGPCC